MKVKLLTSRAGPNFSQTAGEEIEVDKAEGVRMIEDGQAVPVTKKRETATRKPREKR